MRPLSFAQNGQPRGRRLADSLGEQWAAGTQVGPYKIVSRIGEGGMGEVYKARDLRLGREVAIKTAHEEFSGRFQREARAISALNHPNICTLYDIGPNYLVMELVEGETLAKRMQKGALAMDLVLRYGSQIADALSAAHAKGITHRDLKPGNIMITRAGIKVLDFGLAKIEATQDASQNQVETATASQTIVGTPAYMAPEQLEGTECGPRTDIFALGLVLYEMATGKRPFRGESRAALIADILRREPDISALSPPPFALLVERCLAKDPEHRWQSAHDLKIQLDFQGRAVPPAPSAAIRKSWRGRMIPAAAIASIIVVAVIAAWSLRQKQFDPIVTQLTSYPGSKRQPDLSPDGTQVAFVWNGQSEDSYNVYVKQIGPADPMRITTNTTDDHLPRWSPDGKWIAFLRGRPGEPKGVFVIPAFGGRERQVGEAVNTSVLNWSPDGKWLLATRRASPDKSVGLALVSVETSQWRQVTSPEIGEYDFPASFAPNGHTLAFLRHPGDPMLLSLSEAWQPLGDPRRFPVETGRSINGLTWSADGRELVLSTGPSESAAIWRVATAIPSHPQRLRLAESASAATVSRAGNRMVFERYNEESNIYSLELDASGRATGSAVRAFDSSKTEICPSISPDGNKVAFESSRSGNAEIWVCQMDGSRCAPITTFENTHAGSPAWSADGDWIAFDVFRQLKSELYVVNANGGKPRLLENVNGLIPRWSLDGQSIFFRCGASVFLTEMAGEMFAEVNICQVPAGGGAVKPVTRGGGAVAQQSRDGKWIYYSGHGAAGATTLARIPTAGGQPETVLPEVAGRNFVVVDDGIWFVTPPTAEGNLIQFYDFATRSFRTVYRMPRPAGPGFTITPNRRRILFTQGDRGATYDLMLVEQFR